MKVVTLTLTLLVVSSSCDAQFWKYSQQLFNPFAWIRQGKTGDSQLSTQTQTQTQNQGKSTPSFQTGTTINAFNLNQNQPSTNNKIPIPLPLSYPPAASPPAEKTALPLPSSSLPPVALSTNPITSIPTSTKTTEGPKIAPQTPEVVKKEKLPEVQLSDIKPKPQTEKLQDHLESKMDEIDLGPVIAAVKATQPPITTTNAKSPRTTLSERSNAGITASTTKRALKIKSTSSPLAYYSHSSNSLPTRHHLTSQNDKTSPVWTTVPITTHHHKTATDRIHSTHHHLSQSQSQSQGQPQQQSVSYSSYSSSSSSGSSPHLVGTTAALRGSSSSSASSSTATVTEATTMYFDTTTQEATGTTEEPRDNHRQHDFYLSKREKPQVKIATNISQNLLPLPAGASAALVKPTKYHYYPHNQHIYLLPECAIQQVCNAVYVRLNWTQPLCACPSRYRDPCSASLNSDDQHTTELQVDRSSKRALTLVKTCEPTTDMRVCRSPRDWSLLALQNIRTGKSHYLVICRCPDTSILEGPMSHDQPTYASVPGIRVYGMMCVQPPQQSSQTSSQSSNNKRRGRPLRLTRSIESDPPFPWEKAVEFAKTADWED